MCGTAVVDCSSVPSCSPLKFLIFCNGFVHVGLHVMLCGSQLRVCLCSPSCVES